MTTTNTPRTTTPADLQGLRRAILTPREIVRDQHGMLSHPAIPYLDEDVNYQTFFAAFGIESAFVCMETDVDGDAYDRYVESNDPSVSFWTPSAPDGEGWLLIEIYDTDDGPVALYVREKKRESMRDRLKREEQETRAPAQAAEPVAWQYRVVYLDYTGPWIHTTKEGMETLRDTPNGHCEVRDLYAAPQPPAQADAREPKIDAQREGGEIAESLIHKGEVARSGGTREGLTDEQRAIAWNEYRKKCRDAHDELPDIADFFAGWDAALLEGDKR